MTTAWGQVLPEEQEPRVARDTGYYAFAAFAGMFAGWVDIKVGDLLFTALLVCGPCMLLGLMRPQRPWRWVAIVGICVPVAVLLDIWYSRRNLAAPRSMNRSWLFYPVSRAPMEAP